MKKFLLSLCVAMLSCIAFAQQPPKMVYVLLKDGTQVKYLADDIDRISVKYAAVPAEKTGLNFAYDATTMTASVTAGKEVTSLTIPSKVLYGGKEYDVTSIEEFAIADWSSLTSVEIPNSITSIGEAAFFYCYNLTSIEIPESVTTIGVSAFDYCTGLTSVVIGNSVTSIGASAFSDCHLLKSVVIGNSVTSIGAGAFYGCTSLTSINIPYSVTSIGARAFNGCTDLTSIEIPSSVTEIGVSAFDGCPSLKTARVPLRLKGKVESAFPSNCEIEWYGKEETAIPVDQTGLKFMYDYRNMTASVTGVYNKEVTSVEMPYKVSYVNKEYDVTSIGASAFVNCTSLTSIEIPGSVTSIGVAAFSGCAAITSIEIPESVTTIGMTAFMNCTSLTSINIPNSVTTIGANAFSGCTNLTSIEIPSSVTSIGANAFWACERLTSINIPNSVTSIGEDAFKGCYNLKTARVPSSLKGMVETAFPSTCEIVWYDPLTGETLEKGLTFKYNATTMTASVTGFENKTVTEVIIPSVVLYGGKEYVVTSIGEGAFLSRNNLTSIVIPNTVTSIGNTAFSMCAGLTSIEIPYSVTTIGDGAFALSPLTSIVIPESVTSLGENAFYGCLKLETAFVPSSLEGKVESAFPSNCEIKWYDASADQTGLVFCWYVNSYDFAFAYVCGVENEEVDSVTIPYKVLYNGRVYLVTTIGGRAYNWCKNLTSIKIPETITKIEAGAFSGCTNLRTAYVPKGCIISTDYISPSFPERCAIVRY